MTVLAISRSISGGGMSARSARLETGRRFAAGEDSSRCRGRLVTDRSASGLSMAITLAAVTAIVVAGVALLIWVQLPPVEIERREPKGRERW